VPKPRLVRTLSCRLQVQVPEDSWLSVFTRAHPEVVVQVADRLELERDAALFEVRIVPGRGGLWSSEIRSMPGVREVELLRAGEDAEQCRVFFHGGTFIPLFREIGLIRKYPYPVRNGTAQWTVIGPAAKVRTLVDRLRERIGQAGVESVLYGPTAVREDRLTQRQKEVLQEAMEAGYFEVPRKISLTELAAHMGIAVSTLSVTLAVIEKKVLEARRTLAD
jgi:predicted DNA binding protein